MYKRQAEYSTGPRIPLDSGMSTSPLYVPYVGSWVASGSADGRGEAIIFLSINQKDTKVLLGQARTDGPRDVQTDRY